jgi:myo-inositol-1(or 4)-monophosphatase
MNTELENARLVAVELARGAGRILMDGLATMNSDARVDFKSSAVDPVTEFDRKSEDFIVSQIRKHYPSHAIVGEEGGEYAINKTSSRKWYVDPLDGTVNFAHGVPQFSVSLGLVVDGTPAVGVVYSPYSGEMFSASLGGGATFNGKPIHVSRTTTLQRSLLATGFPYDRQTSEVNNFQNFINFKRNSQAVRRFGSAAVDVCWVACGRFDGYWELKINPHDLAAAIVVLREAGGRITDFSGGDAFFAKKEAIASNGLIHEQMMRILKSE